MPVLDYSQMGALKQRLKNDSLKRLTVKEATIDNLLEIVSGYRALVSTIMDVLQSDKPEVAQEIRKQVLRIENAELLKNERS